MDVVRSVKPFVRHKWKSEIAESEISEDEGKPKAESSRSRSTENDGQRYRTAKAISEAPQFEAESSRTGRYMTIETVHVTEAEDATVSEAQGGSDETFGDRASKESIALIRRRTRKKKKETPQQKPKLPNPFGIEKSHYNRRIFEVNNPFVVVRSTLDIVAGLSSDKVGDRKSMKPEVLRYGTRMLIKPMLRTKRTYKRPRTELSGRTKHTAILQNLVHLTRRSESVQTIYFDNEDEGGGGDGPGTDPDEDDDIEDLLLKAGGLHVVTVDDPLTGESLELQHEGGDFVNVEELAHVTKFDLKACVRDKKIKGEDNFVTVLLIECQWDQLSINKLYQAGGYSMKDAKQNIKKGRYRPIYLQAWGESSWRYGILFPYGTVKVKGGHVVDYGGNDRSRISVDKLDTLLQKRTKNLCNDYEVEGYPDNDYIHGHLYVCEKKFMLPEVVKGGWHNNDYQMFFQALIRIVCGDKALEWTLEDIKAIVKARKEQDKQDVQDFFFASI